jgi:hypothetical protein
MEALKGTPDIFQHPDYTARPYAGPNWLASFSESVLNNIRIQSRFHTADLSNIDFIPLSSAVGLAALLERLATDPLTTSIGIDLKGTNSGPLLSTNDYIRERKRAGANKEKWTQPLVQAWRVYEVAGFLESLGLSGALNIPGRGNRINYTWVGEEGARLRKFATRDDEKPTVVMRLMRIETKEHCKQFLEADQIVAWREAMGHRFRSSPLFEFEELWRIFCHELAVNIYEHAGTAGFLAARVVEPDAFAAPWCRMSYPSEVQSLFPRMSEGFIELCVSDSGQGFAATLEASYRRQALTPKESAITPEEILPFAFDEVGTCKNLQESWATERHALGRILQIVAKYGGALTLQSSGVEVAYVSKGGAFERIPNHLGYRPQKMTRVGKTLGSHLQLILPLIPFTPEGREDWRKSILVDFLPTAFYADPRQVRGHLLPIYEALDSQEPCVGKLDVLRFQKKCEVLAQKLIMERPSLEPLILDFSNLHWTAAQFETLLYLLQNVLQHRPVLFVEMDPNLAREIIRLEQTGSTELHSGLPDRLPSVTGRSYDEISERNYLETYQRVHSTVLGLDIHGKRYIFGLNHRWCEPVLLSLIDHPKTLPMLCDGRTVEDHRVLKGIFNNVNPLFFHDDKGFWRTIWDNQSLANETQRAMSKHFEKVADRCDAWRGRTERKQVNVGPDGQPSVPQTAMTFNLPWQNEWTIEFFETSRILSRQRYADEAAQRLIFRLEKGLQINGKNLSEVLVLACVTAPAILLAAALHRWWPSDNRPAIADLGPYLMLDPDGSLPAIASAGGIVIVQDILDRKQVSTRLLELLKRQQKEVLCILSLASFVDDSTKLGMTPIDAGWRDPGEVKTHAMINLLRAERCAPSDHDDPRAHWVEPRTLRPFRYSTLRRELKEKPTLRERARPFFAPQQKGVICAGHYVYGERHYSVALDIKRAVEGEIGGEISAWLADICQGVRNRGSAPFVANDFKKASGVRTRLLNGHDPVSRCIVEQFSPASRKILEQPNTHESELQFLLAKEFNAIRQNETFHEKVRFPENMLSPKINDLLSQGVKGTRMFQLNRLLLEDAFPGEIRHYPDSAIDWESPRSLDFDGDVTVVLMPLHSQIHYLWPRVESLLAQRGRRQPMWLLDATLFLGHGPAYRLPYQIDQQIRMAMRRLVNARRSGSTDAASGLRILILDDAMVSARTAETILAELDRTVAKACEDLGNAEGDIRPVEWIRYFTIFNQMGQSKHQHWHSLREVGSVQSIPFVFEEYRSITGVPVFEELNCPSCADLRRMDRLMLTAERHSAQKATVWAAQRRLALKATAIDSPGFQRNPVPLPRMIDLLARKNKPRKLDKYQVSNADEAILRFYELMYMSYPPTDVLPSLSAPNAWGAVGESQELIAEYERYRWSVFEWCLRNWPRLIADSARAAFFKCVHDELKAETKLVENIFEGLARLRQDQLVKEFIVMSIQMLVELEKQPRTNQVEESDQKKLLLEKALTLFLLNIPDDELKVFEINDRGINTTLLDYLAKLAHSFTTPTLTFTGHLHLCFTRSRKADPAWGLQVLAENLFRGRDPDDPAAGSHRLLPRLLSELDLGSATASDCRLLQCSLSLFLAALDDMSLFAAEHAIPFGQIKSLGNKVLDWLNANPEGGAPPKPITDLCDALSMEGDFCTNFGRIFHESVENLRPLLLGRAEEIKMKGGQLDFEFAPSLAVKRFRVLAPIQRLDSFLTNWAIDRASKDQSRVHKSRIEVHRQPMPVGTDRLRFRILTNFAPLRVTQDRTVHGDNYDVEIRGMTMFGGMLPDHWEIPTDAEKALQFTAAYEFLLPIGFKPRSHL